MIKELESHIKAWNPTSRAFSVIWATVQGRAPFNVNGRLGMLDVEWPNSPWAGGIWESSHCHVIAFEFFSFFFDFPYISALHVNAPFE